MSIHFIAKTISKHFPLKVAQTEWDNVGILIDTGTDVKNVMITVDITRDVVKECLSFGIKNIISYHPVIFRPIKSLKQDDIVTKLVKNGINVFVPHTSWDPTINKYIYLLFNKDYFENNCGNNYRAIHEVIYKLKLLCGVSHIRTAFSKHHHMQTVPPRMVVGAGAAFKYHNYKNCLILTGEMDHHVILHSIKNNNTVILLEHSTSERIAMHHFFRVIPELLPEYDVYLSKDVDPIKIV